MELRKTSESVNRAYDAEGNVEERVDSVNYEVLDADGSVLGSAYVGSGNASASINFYGFGGIAAGEARLRNLLGIEIPNP